MARFPSLLFASHPFSSLCSAASSRPHLPFPLPVAPPPLGSHPLAGSTAAVDDERDRTIALDIFPKKMTLYNQYGETGFKSAVGLLEAQLEFTRILDLPAVPPPERAIRD